VFLKVGKQYVSKRKKFVKKPFDYNVSTASATVHQESRSEKKLYFHRNDFVAVRSVDGMIVELLKK